MCLAVNVWGVNAFLAIKPTLKCSAKTAKTWKPSENRYFYPNQLNPRTKMDPLSPKTPPNRFLEDFKLSLSMSFCGVIVALAADFSWHSVLLGILGGQAVIGLLCTLGSLIGAFWGYDDEEN